MPTCKARLKGRASFPFLPQTVPLPLTLHLLFTALAAFLIFTPEPHSPAAQESSRVPQSQREMREVGPRHKHPVLNCIEWLQILSTSVTELMTDVGQKDPTMRNSSLLKSLLSGSLTVLGFGC